MINICDNENKIIKIDKKDKIYEETNKLCLICMDVDGEIILCSKCKYIYCFTCAEKINMLCCICFRNRNTTNINQNYYQYYDYTSYYDELVFELPIMHYFFVIANFVTSTIIDFCWIILFVLFGYIGIIFLLHTIINTFFMIIEYIELPQNYNIEM